MPTDDHAADHALKADRRRALVAAAYRRIASGGFEGLRTRDVAADVGVNVATLHYYFPTKEALIRGVIGQSVPRFQATMPGDGSAVDQLRGHLRALARLLKEDQELWRSWASWSCARRATPTWRGCSARPTPTGTGRCAT